MNQYAHVGSMRGAARLKVIRAHKRLAQRIEERTARRAAARREAHVNNLVEGCVGDKALARAIIDWLVGRSLVFPREIRLDGKRVLIVWNGVPTMQERRCAESVVASVYRECAVCLHKTPAGTLRIQMDVLL